MILIFHRVLFLLPTYFKAGTYTDNFSKNCNFLMLQYFCYWFKINDIIIGLNLYINKFSSIWL